MKTYERLADLPLTIDSYRLEGLQLEVPPAFTRRTTLIQLTGSGHAGVGEDVTYGADEQEAFQAQGAILPLAGTHTLDTFSGHLAALELFPTRPSMEAYRNYRRWAFESAALDLALRQAETSLAARLGVELAPLTFVASMGLGHPPSCDRLLRWLELYPGLGFKLDASSDWDDGLVSGLVASGAVRTIDLKGAYHGTPVDQPADPELYARIVSAFPEAWIEDPALTPATRGILEGRMDRVTWDAPIHGVDDVRALAHEPKVINIKPSRFGSVRALMEAYDHCRERGIGMYGGGQFELGDGRGQIQYLASLFHPDAPNDVAPGRYNDPTPAAGLETSPLPIRSTPLGFRRQTP